MGIDLIQTLCLFMDIVLDLHENARKNKLFYNHLKCIIINLVNV